MIKNNDKKWFVIISKIRWEKKVAKSLSDLGFEIYLPLKKEKKQWSDRVKTIETPLMNSYVFIHCTEQERFLSFDVNGVKTYLMNHGKLAVVQEKEINILKMIENQNIEFSARENFLKKGELVEIFSGPFMGFQGKIVEYRGKSKFVIDLQNLNYSIVIDKEINDLKLVG
jgi:transcription antitermination factor NusG